VPFTLKRLLEDGFFWFREKVCTRCGMTLTCFAKGRERKWCNKKLDVETRKMVYQEHDVYVCDGRRGRRKAA
jgi:hypothetical protein